MTSGISVAYCQEIRSDSEEGKKKSSMFLKILKNVVSLPFVRFLQFYKCATIIILLLSQILCVLFLCFEVRSTLQPYLS